MDLVSLSDCAYTNKTKRQAFTLNSLKEGKINWIINVVSVLFQR